MNEPEEYIEILKEQLETKARLIESMSQLIREKDQEIILLKEALRVNPRGIDK